jgi:hypothetical protein
MEETGAISQARSCPTSRMPKSDNFDGALVDDRPVIQKVVHAIEKDAPHAGECHVPCYGADSRRSSNQIESSPELLFECVGCFVPIRTPPPLRLGDLARRPACESDRKRLTQSSSRKVRRTSSAGMISPRSASASESRSSASALASSSKLSSRSRARTVTTAPSGSGSPSTTI